MQKVEAPLGKQSATAEQEERKGEDAERSTEALPHSESGIVKMLRECSDLNSEFLQRVCDALGQYVGTRGVYIAEKLSGEGGDSGASNSVIKYIASTTEQQFLRQSTLREGEGGVTWKAWVMPEAVEDAPPEDGAEEGQETEKKPKAAPTLPTIHVSNVLRNHDVVFHRVPKPGAYVAVPFEYGTVLHENGLPPISLDSEAPQADGEEKNEEEDAEASAPAAPVIPSGNGLKRSLALCVDTMGQNRDFTATELTAIKTITDELKATFERTEKIAYEAEYNAAKEWLRNGAEVAAAAFEKEKEALQGKRKLHLIAHPTPTLHRFCYFIAAAESEALGNVDAEAAEEYKAHARAVAALQAAKTLVQERAASITELQSRRIQPKSEVIKVLQAVWFLLGYTREQLADNCAADPKAFQWEVARPHLATLVQQVRDFDPLTTTKPLKYQTSEALRNLVAGLSPEEVDKVNVAAGPLLSFVLAALDTREATAAKERKQAEEEAERKRLEEEEAARIAAEEAAAKAEGEAAQQEGEQTAATGEGEGEAAAAEES